MKYLLIKDNATDDIEVFAGQIVKIDYYKKRSYEYAIIALCDSNQLKTYRWATKGVDIIMDISNGIVVDDVYIKILKLRDSLLSISPAGYDNINDIKVRFTKGIYPTKTEFNYMNNLNKKNKGRII